MPVEALAQVVLDAERDPAGDEAAAEGEPEPQHPGADDRERQRQQRRRGRRSLIASTAWPTSHGISTVIPIASQAKDERDPELAPVGTQEAEQAPEGAHPHRLYKVK